MMFELGCKLYNLDEQKVALGVPALAELPSYWNETRPRNIFHKHVNLEGGDIDGYEQTKLPNIHTILARRE